ncbi:MAG TPA: methylated-DNA--[protein]-cysteine S-methyltransferase [Acetobacteraceae bacterium]|jgi:AraC family transcriptional regulator of adaptative response/methylated-DNA-[protein]-cysteine methyltransferase|nr:methylated-DNA--[protein]-cysteine S-methyltransferase [Acetobacteraceae bacterium]
MSKQIRCAWGESSLGAFLVAASDRGLVALEFADQPASALASLHHRFADTAIIEDSADLSPTVTTLTSLIDHPGTAVDLPLDPRGSGPERRVWDALCAIPPGQTASYGEIAARLGPPHDARSVGEACAANTLALLIPCHRVVKKDGGLSGYRWGVRRKRALLAREQSATAFALA